MKVTGRHLWLVVGFLGLLGCASLPEQPAPSSPYGMLSFPNTIQLLAVNTRTIDARLPVRTLRVSPGQHALHLMYMANGPGGSMTHHGQHAAPFTLVVQEGTAYHFIAKTWGIIWRPEVASTATIANYCQTHACKTVVQQPVQLLPPKDCN